VSKTLIGLGKKYLGEGQIIPLFTVGQKYAWVVSGPISTHPKGDLVHNQPAVCKIFDVNSFSVQEVIVKGSAFFSKKNAHLLNY